MDRQLYKDMFYVSSEYKLTRRLYDKKWVIWDSDDLSKNMIFRKSGELLLVNEGVIEKGSWEYIKAEKYFLLNIGGISSVYEFKNIKNKVLILSKYRSDEDPIILIDETDSGIDGIINLVNQERLKKYNLLQVELIDGRILEIILGNDKSLIGKAVTFERAPLLDSYVTTKDNRRFSINDSKIKFISDIEIVDLDKSLRCELNVESQNSGQAFITSHGRRIKDSCYVNYYNEMIYIVKDSILLEKVYFIEMDTLEGKIFVEKRYYPMTQICQNMRIFKDNRIVKSGEFNTKSNKYIVSEGILETIIKK